MAAGMGNEEGKLGIWLPHKYCDLFAEGGDFRGLGPNVGAHLFSYARVGPCNRLLVGIIYRPTNQCVQELSRPTV